MVLSRQSSCVHLVDVMCFRCVAGVIECVNL